MMRYTSVNVIEISFSKINLLKLLCYILFCFQTIATISKYFLYYISNNTVSFKNIKVQLMKSWRHVVEQSEAQMYGGNRALDLITKYRGRSIATSNLTIHFTFCFVDKG